jgi:predicted anti-sigma-YlaC factor YlaD
MMKETDCAALRRHVQDCLDRGEAPPAARTEAHLAACPDCRAWRETLLAAAAGLRAALDAEIAALPPPAFDARRAALRAERARRRRRLAGIAAALVLAVGLSAAGAGIYGRRRSLTLAEAGSSYLLDLLFADSLLLEDADPVLEGNGSWLAGTLESGELFTMEPLTVF